MYVVVVFVMRCLYSAMSLTLVTEQRFIRIIYYYDDLNKNYTTPVPCLVVFLGLHAGDVMRGLPDGWQLQ